MAGVWAEGLRAVLIFLAGFAAGTVTLAVWQRRTGEKVPTNRVLAGAILAVTMGASLLGVVNAYGMRDQAECQSRVNQRFLESLTANVDLNRANRDALDRAIEQLSEDSESDRGRILGEYLAERERIESEREEYPPPPEEVCG